MSEKRHYNCLEPITTLENLLHHSRDYDPKSSRVTLEESVDLAGKPYVAVWDGSSAYGVNAQPDFDTAEKWLATKYQQVFLVAVTITKKYTDPIRIRP